MFTAISRPVDGTTQYLYGNPGNPFQLTASRATDNTLTTYSYDTSGNLFAFERAGSRYYVATDHLGTPILATADTGTLIWQGGFEPFGENWNGAMAAGVFLGSGVSWYPRPPAAPRKSTGKVEAKR